MSIKQELWDLLPGYLAAVKQRMAERPYQIVATERAWTRKRHVVDGKPGSGKTLIVLTATMLQRPKRVLIICSKNALHTWYKEILKWFPAFAEYYVVVSGSPAQRQTLWSVGNWMFYACTYTVSQIDLEYILAQDWDVLIMDEYQKGGLLTWKGRGKDKKGKSKMTMGYQTVNQLRHIPSIYPTTGTTTKRGAQHLWPILNILDQKMFSSYWKFVERFCVVNDGMFGKEIIGPQNTQALKETIKPYYHRVPRSETDKYMPKLQRQIIPIDMTPQQEKLYKQIDEEMWYLKEDGTIKTASTLLAKITRLRQVLVTPQILQNGPTNDWGASVAIIKDMIEERGTHHTVIFTPFRPAVEAFEGWFKSQLKTDDVFHLWGGTEPNDLRDIVRKWKESKGLMICTTMFSQSFELDTTDFCFFAGYECEFTDNEQCEGRLRRITNTTPNPIQAYYLQNRNTYDERWLEILIEKKQSVKYTFQDMEEARQYLRG